MEIPADRAEMTFFRLGTRLLPSLLASGILVPGLWGAETPPPNPREFFDTHCVACHNQKANTAGLALDRLDAAKPAANAEVWERVIGKLRAGSMPPPGLPRPDAATYHALA